MDREELLAKLDERLAALNVEHHKALRERYQTDISQAVGAMAEVIKLKRWVQKHWRA